MLPSESELSPPISSIEQVKKEFNLKFPNHINTPLKVIDEEMHCTHERVPPNILGKFFAIKYTDAFLALGPNSQFSLAIVARSPETIQGLKEIMKNLGFDIDALISQRKAQKLPPPKVGAPYASYHQSADGKPQFQKLSSAPSAPIEGSSKPRIDSTSQTPAPTPTGDGKVIIGRAIADGGGTANTYNSINGAGLPDSVRETLRQAGINPDTGQFFARPTNAQTKNSVSIETVNGKVESINGVPVKDLPREEVGAIKVFKGVRNPGSSYTNSVLNGVWLAGTWELDSNAGGDPNTVTYKKVAN